VNSKSSGTSGAKPLRCLRNWDGLRSPISSTVSNRRMRCSLEGDSRCTSSFRSFVYGSRSGGEVIISMTSAAYRWSSCDITWKNFVVSLLTLAKKNCASARANHTAGRSAHNGGSRTATLDTSTGCEPSATSMLRRGHQCGMSVFVDNHYNKYSQLESQTIRKAGRSSHSVSWLAAEIAGPEKGDCVAVS
jgi:hypothetical protein